MKIITTLADMQKTTADLRRQDWAIGLVPTMGALHEGHMSLIRLARETLGPDSVIVVSIFVNPLQFGPQEDLAAYPRDLERDQKLCQEADVDIVFCPAAEELCLADATVMVDDSALTKTLCGASRPGHFRGVLTIVSKLFNIVTPELAVFGQKDAQQARLMRQLVRDLNYATRIVVGPIVREPDGLALSSRNAYLTPEERSQATSLSKALKAARKLYQGGERHSVTLKQLMAEEIKANAPSAKVDYIEIVDQQTLQPLESLEQPALLAMAVRVGKTRLIDNLLLPDDTLSSLRV